MFKLILDYYPNPQIETRIRVQVIDVHSEFKKGKITLLVMRFFWIC